jgi:hypothetical protein
VRLDTARRFVLSLPETTEEPHFEKSSFRVKGKILATVPEGGKHLHVNVDPLELEALVAADPDAYERIVWGKGEVSDWLRVTLAKAERDVVCGLLEDAWRRKAPKRVLQAYDAERGITG